MNEPVNHSAVDGADDTASAASPAMEGRSGCADDSPMETLVARVGYKGAAYAGFAEQEKQAHVKTVAGELRQAFRTILRRDVELTCAGRTDAGVHARSQYVSLPFSTQEFEGRAASRLVRSLSAVLPEDIRVHELYRAPQGFSARFDARARRYRYHIMAGPVAPLFSADWCWWIRSAKADVLDVDAMNEAAHILIGEHDFKSFCKAQSAVDKPTCRFVMSAGFEHESVLGEDTLVFDIVGNAFLHSMVRTIVGTLVEVGLNRHEPAWVGEVLAACDRNAAGPCAPACGLTFWDVQYPDDVLKPW